MGSMIWFIFGYCWISCLKVMIWLLVFVIVVVKLMFIVVLLIDFIIGWLVI